MILKVITVIVGAFLLLQAMGWVLDPSAAAAGLGMTIVEGVGANTQIGDFTSFFFSAGLFAVLGAIKEQHQWLYGSIALLGSAAIFRLLSVFLHGTEPLVSAIIFEVLILSLIHIRRCRRSYACRSRWSPYH